MRTPLNRRSLLLAILSVCAGRHAYALDRPRLIVLGEAVTSPIVAFGVGGAIAPKREMSLRGWLVCNGAEAIRHHQQYLAARALACPPGGVMVQAVERACPGVGGRRGIRLPGHSGGCGLLVVPSEA
jgi:hypothetical protein